MSTTLFKSARKMDSLPVGSVVRFSGTGRAYHKIEKGWLEKYASFPIPRSAETVRACNVNYPFEVVSVGGAE